jgi:hypothetical protein
MGAKYIRKTSRGIGGNWTQENMEGAVKAVQNGMSYTNACIQFGVPRSTLALKTRGWKGRVSTLDNRTPEGRKLTIPPEDEVTLAGMLKTMIKWGFGLGKADVLNVIQEYVTTNKVQRVCSENLSSSVKLDFLI